MGRRLCPVFQGVPQAPSHGAGTIPVFFDKHLYHTLPYADILPWDQISVMIDFDWLEAAQLNALDVLQQRFSREEALLMARKARTPLVKSNCIRFLK